MDINGIIATVTTVALGIVIIGGKAEKIIAALKELADVLTAITDALGDKKLTAEEIEKIKLEAKEALIAFKAIIGA